MTTLPTQAQMELAAEPVVLPSRMERVFTFAGKEHEVSPDEWYAIERSGRSSWQDYRRTPSEWQQPTPGKVQAMHQRPGAVEPGERPIHGSPVDWQRKGPTVLHMSRPGIGHTQTACGKAGDVFALPVEHFATVYNDTRSCGSCVKALKLMARKSHQAEKYHWEGSNCRHVRDKRAWTYQDNIINGRDFNAALMSERCQYCHRQFQQA